MDTLQTAGHAIFPVTHEVDIAKSSQDDFELEVHPYICHLHPPADSAAEACAEEASSQENQMMHDMHVLILIALLNIGLHFLFVLACAQFPL